MHIPGIRERVRIRDRSGLFLVIRVDHERRVADLVHVTDGYSVDEDVPFDRLLNSAESEDAAPSHGVESESGPTEAARRRTIRRL